MSPGNPRQEPPREEESARHVPVLPEEVAACLKLPRGGCYVDCTLGLAGHAARLAREIGPEGRIIGLDRDRSALDLAAERLRKEGVRAELVHRNYRDLDRTLDALGVKAVDGFLFDLGLSSLQLDDPGRGFSLMREGPLDMRMDGGQPLSAEDLVNTLSERELSRILEEYGEERFHRRIARALVRKRPVTSTDQLKRLILQAVPRTQTRYRIHPATRTFQALRIAVNDELASLAAALEKCPDYLRPGGRIAVIAFHSLEDRIVKQNFRQLAGAGIYRLVVKKPLRPSDEETARNPRARSARLRAAERSPSLENLHLGVS